MRRPKPVELLRPKHARHLSIVDLICLVTACAVFFGGVRLAGWYGLVLGCFALQAAAGRLLRRNDWQLAACTAAITMAASLIAIWAFHGKLGDVDPRFVKDTSDRLRSVQRWLDEHRERTGQWPERLGDMEPRVRGLSSRTRRIEDVEPLMRYARQDDSFELAFFDSNSHLRDELGKLHDLRDLDRLAQRRVSLGHFFFVAPGTWTFLPTLAACGAIACVLPNFFRKESGQFGRDLAAALILSVPLSLIAFHLAKLCLKVAAGL